MNSSVNTIIKPDLTCKFYCEKCDYGTSKKSNITNHNNSAKHKNNNDLNEFKQSLSINYTCGICNKEYKSRVGLWGHKKKCFILVQNQNNNNNSDIKLLIDLFKLQMNNPHNNDVILELMKQNKEFKELIIEQKNTPANNDELVAELLKQNNEFKELMLEQSKYMMELASKAGNNNNNKTFNLTFLDEMSTF